jgi:hypothetical protein
VRFEIKQRSLILTELIVILGELAIAYGTILVHDTTNFNDARHARGVPAELNYLDLTFYRKISILV